MEIWVRSQNKKRLMKVEMVEIDKQKDGGAIIYSHEYILGEYKTKERAMEVLDEIEEILMPKMKVVHNKVERKDLDSFRTEYIMQPMIEDIQVLEASSYVYKMPKE